MNKFKILKSTKKILIATNNPGKFKEIKELLPKKIRYFKPRDFNMKEPVENGKTFQANAKIKSEIKSSLIYPVIIFVLAITVSLALLIFIVPTFEEMFADMGATLPALTRFMLSLSRFVTSSTFVISAPLIIFSAIYLFFMTKIKIKQKYLGFSGLSLYVIYVFFSDICSSRKLKVNCKYK